jgi:hypothetical protein
VYRRAVNVYEVAGWIGAALVVGAYAMVTRLGTSVVYHVVNLLGAAGLLVNALHHRALPSTAVNVVWGAIAVWGMVGARRVRPRPAGAADPST